MKDVFLFDKMLTPKIITFVYWLMLFGVVIGGFGSIFTGSFFMGLAILIGGAISARIWCELLIVLFKINEHTQIIAGKATPLETTPIPEIDHPRARPEYSA